LSNLQIAVDAAVVVADQAEPVRPYPHRRESGADPESSVVVVAEVQAVFVQ
jgi:hypothetical protein